MASKSSTQSVDILVIGDHPCAYLATALLRERAPALAVGHCVVPGESDQPGADRLVLVNPEFFSLHPLLGSLKRRLDLTPIYGLTFLADDPDTSSFNATKTIGAYVASFKQIRAGMIKLARNSDATFFRPPHHLELRQLDETGVTVGLDHTQLHPKLLIVGADLPVEMKRMIGLPPSWDAEVMHRYTFLRLKGGKWHTPAARAMVPMSLDLKGTLNWAWLLPAAGQVQLCVVQPLRSVEQFPAKMLLRHWIEVLGAHKALQGSASAIDQIDQAVSMDLPLGGALAQEGVANRTLLIGPAGGFYTACAEDIYPNCWSAVHATEVAEKALKERHAQDALQPYRQQWGATLGDYLRGPQQNLRFLLPLVYRNSTMTARLAEAILRGKSVVR